ncbi:MAG: hemin uptake protein HemP [Planctomycetes bacterium]|nr:hemin uptake protein HemP [Planctomycetota bacterium]
MTESADRRNESGAPPAEEPKGPPRVVSAQDLFAGKREICIEHEGERYVLRITRRGKLILQK